MTAESFATNQEGFTYYKKWVKETKYGLIFYTPALLFFYLGVGILIYGFSLKFILISIFPVGIILSTFVRPYYSRKKYINRTVKNITISDNGIFLETYSWFSSYSIKRTTSLNGISLSDFIVTPFFREKKVYSLSIDNDKFFLIPEFFNNIDPLLSQLNRV